MTELLPDLLAAALLLSLVVYVLLGGADFGGGVWDLLARGPRAAAQRETIADAIGPIWEANHVWMIAAVVLLFSAFPPAFAAIMTALHIPVTLMLVGIVLRGSAFVFRKADPAGEGVSSGWQRAFAGSSLLTPVMLGVVVGTISTPAVGLDDGVVTGGFFRPWLRPFPWAVGLLTLSLFAFLAATYLTVEAERDAELAGDFRRRALGAAGAVAVAGTVAAVLAPGAAPDLTAHLLGSGWGVATVVLGGCALAGTAAALWGRRYRLARPLAAATAVFVMLGWGFGQYPWLMAGALTIEGAAAPPETLLLVGVILVGAAIVLAPAFLYLYRTFKGGILAPPREGGRG